MSISAQVRERLISSFRAELAEHVQTMTDGLLALEQGRVAGQERQATLEDMFRAAHSLKGAARAVGVTAIEQLAHALEDLLAAMQRDGLELTPALFTACYQALDAIQAVQGAYEAGETTPPVQVLQALADLEPFRTQVTAGAGEPAPPAPAAPIPPPDGDEAAPRRAAPDETIRVGVSKLDALMAQLSELLVTKIRAEQRLAQVRQIQEFMALWQKEWLGVRSTYGRLARRSQDLNGARNASVDSTRRPELGTVRRLAPDGDGYRELGRDLAQLLDYVGVTQERLRDVNVLLNTLTRQYADDTMHMALTIDGLEQEIKRVRMLPLSTITGPFGRMVRDLAQEAGKEAVLYIVGGDTELDKQVLEQIKDPLIHLLRNAIDHGIERPVQRKARGKPRIGTVTLTAEQLGQDVLICVSDDGAGLDLAAIRQAAARQGVADAGALSEAELKELIFKAGISTSPIITDISGRGIGLDVVRRNVEALHGRIDVDSTPGEGAVFTLTLPLTLTSSRGLLVRVANQLFAVKLSAIVRMDDVGPEEIVSLEGHDTIRHNGRPLTLVRLSDVLGLPRVPRDEARSPYVILAAAERRMAFAVDELVGEQEVVIKGLGRQLTRVGGIAGATVMGSGEVVLILHEGDLIKLAVRGERRSIFDTGGAAAAPTATRAQQRILIVDDSITTRTLEKNILETVGYSVQLAIDGQEALGVIAAEGVPDLVVSDILMPRMDGFEFTQRLKGDERTANVPVILVTSLDSAADKARGIEVGADAYIVKSSFDQNNLLETIEQLI